VNAYRDRSILLGKPDPADELLENTPDIPSGNPGFSRWDACQDCGLLPETPEPAEAGTPVGWCLD